MKYVHNIVLFTFVSMDTLAVDQIILDKMLVFRFTDKRYSTGHEMLKTMPFNQTSCVFSIGHILTVNFLSGVWNSGPTNQVMLADFS